MHNNVLCFSLASSALPNLLPGDVVPSLHHEEGLACKSLWVHLDDSADSIRHM